MLCVYVVCVCVCCVCVIWMDIYLIKACNYTFWKVTRVFICYSEFAVVQMNTATNSHIGFKMNS